MEPAEPADPAPAPTGPPVEVILPPKEGTETDFGKTASEGGIQVQTTESKDARPSSLQASAQAVLLPRCQTDRTHAKGSKAKKEEKCIPDEGRGRKPYTFGKPVYKDKDAAYYAKRRSSKLAFAMPKIREPEEIEQLKTQKMVHKLLKYMKRSWKVKLDHRQPDKDLVYRSIETVHSRKSENFEDPPGVRPRKEIRTGFFCNYDPKYPDVYTVELDTPMLVFNNLAPDLKIRAARWLQMKAHKEELKRKRDAHHPRLQSGKSRKPNITRGKLIKDPGGLKLVDDFIATAEKFQKLCSGTSYFNKVLQDWAQKKEDEDQNANSGFGSVPPDFRYGFKAFRPPDEEDEEPSPEEMMAMSKLLLQEASVQGDTKGGPTSASGKAKAPPISFTEGLLDKLDTEFLDTLTFDDDEEEDEEEEMEEDEVDLALLAALMDDGRESGLDERKAKRELDYMEQVIHALYYLIKSTVNVKMKQLQSTLPLPLDTVLELRDKSPEPRDKPKSPTDATPTIKNLRRRRVGGGALKKVDSNRPTKDQKKTTPTDNSPAAVENNNLSEEEICDHIESEIKATVQTPHSMRKSMKEKLGEHDPIHVHASDVISSSPVHSTHKVIQEIKRTHSMSERMMERKGTVSAQQKIKTLKESTEHAAQRMARNYATYGRLFERNMLPKKPIWQDIEVDQAIDKYTKMEDMTAKDPARLNAADAEEIVEMAIRRREILPSSKRWPDADDIPTPTFPFPRSPRRVSSEEQSRRNLATSMPHMDEVPSSPIKRLYKLAGVRTTEKQTYNTLLDMKRAFRGVERKVRIYVQNEIGKMEFDTMKRYKAKLNAIFPDSIFNWCVFVMRQAIKANNQDEEEDTELHRIEGVAGGRRQAHWFRKLMEDLHLIGALKHHGCQKAVEQLVKYADIDVKSKHNLFARLCLLVVSLPVTELGSRPWQHAIQFLLENLFGAPKQVLFEWLQYRRLPLLV